MAPGRKRGSGRAATAAAAAARQQLKVGDLVLAKMKGFPAWPAEITEPEKWGFSAVRKKLLVFFYGTKQIAFCNYADIEPFTEEKKKSLLLKRQGKGADFVRAANEIIEVYENMRKQSVDIITSGEKVIEMKLEKLESAKCDSSGKSPEPSSINDYQKLKGGDDLKESRDVSNLEDGSRTSNDIDLRKRDLIYDEPIEKVSIPDHLRHSTTTTSTSKKRKLRGTSQNAASLRRSASLSSTDGLDQMDSAFDESRDNSVENMDAKDVPSFVPINNSVEDHGDERSGRDSDTNRINEEKLSTGCKQEALTNGNMIDNVRLDVQLELSKEGVASKKKRKPLRKRLKDATKCGAVNEVAVSQLAQTSTVPEFSDSDNILCEMSIKSDGDEHLPLVKRARVRMGKTSGDEVQFSSSDDVDNKSEVAVNVSSVDLPCKTPSGGDDSPLNGTSLAFTEVVSTSTGNNPSLPSPRDISFWKDKYQVKGFDLDMEASLPPSKRLHRAFEAMSANAAETKESIETLETSESSGLRCSPKKSSPKISSDERAEFSVRILQSSDSKDLLTDMSKFMPQLNKPILPSEAKANNKCSTTSLVDKKCNGVIEAAASFNKKSISDTSADDIQKTNSQSCPSNLTEDINTTSGKGLTVNLCSPDLVIKNESLGILVKENNNGETVKPILDGTNSMLKPASNGSNSDLKPALKVNIDNNIVPPEEVATGVSATNDIHIVNNTRGSRKHSSFHSDEDSQTHNMMGMANEAIQGLTPSDRSCSPELTPLKNLIAAAQAKRFLSRSGSLSDNHMQETPLSPSAIQEKDPSRHFSPLVIARHKSATDDRPLVFHNSIRSPQVGHRPKDFSRSSSRAEANAARKAFEAFLCTLSRTKDSIGRATRLAIDCSKYGIAGEVINIIVHNLERETNLYRRVDFFFLVDSITQCSRNQKGGAGDVYCALVQAVLPRLLASAAPRGSSAFENRKQCLKVLRLWLERKTLPESIIRHHIRELEMLNETTFPGGSSRRSLRTERAFNDPVREMEGMLVDEYGSNTSMQLPILLGTNVFGDEEGSTSEEQSFETVTPERHNDIDHEMGEIQMSSLKHRHVLKDIDGELEMEDAAPCEVGLDSLCHLPMNDGLPNTHNQNDKKQLPSFGPPLPEARPPSPPPLPSSPPPFALHFCTAQYAMPQQLTSDAVSGPPNLHLSVSNKNLQGGHSESGIPNACLAPSESMPYYAPGYTGPELIPPPVTVCTPGVYGNFNASHIDLHSRDNCPPIISSSVNSKPYHLPPPPLPTVSNQFSYIHTKAQRRQPWRNCSVFQDRFSYMPDKRRGNFYSDRDTSGPYHHEVSEGSRFPSAVHPASLHSDKAEGSSAFLRHYCPPREAIPNRNGWSVPPRLSNYSGFTSRPHIEESPTTRAAEVPGYWGPR